MTAHSQDVPSDGPQDTEDRPDLSASGPNANRWKRVACVALGGTLLLRGLRRRSPGGALAALVGGWLFYRGVRSDGRSESTATDHDRSGDDASADPAVTRRSVTVGKPAADLVESWRDPELLSRVVGPAVDVEAAGEDRQRWTVRGPLGRSLSWETRVEEERSGESLRWVPVDGTALFDEASVRFRPAPADRGTEMTLRVRFDPPGGALGSAATKYLGIVPGTFVGKALHRFKSLAETGEIPTLERNPSARGSGDLI